MIVRCVIICFMISISSCLDKTRVPDGVIKPEKMRDIVSDMIRADGLSEEIAQRDSSKDVRQVNLELYNNIFKLHSVTAREFDSSYSFYEKNPALMLAMFDTLNKRALQIDLRRTSPTGDTSSIKSYE